MTRFFRILIPILLSLTVTATANAGTWKTGEGSTVENAILDAIDQLNNASRVRCIDRKVKTFKTTCKPKGPLYSIRLHGDHHSNDCNEPDQLWVEREAAKWELKAKTCTDPCSVPATE